MKPWPIIALIVIVVASVGAAVYYAHEASIVGTPSLCRDPNNISSHVYNPARLQTVRDCITVSGIVNNVMQRTTETTTFGSTLIRNTQVYPTARTTTIDKV